MFHHVLTLVGDVVDGRRIITLYPWNSRWETSVLVDFKKGSSHSLTFLKGNHCFFHSVRALVSDAKVGTFL